MSQQIEVVQRAWKLLSPFHRWFYVHIGLAFLLSALSISITYSGSKILTYLTENNVQLVVASFIAMFVIEIIWNYVDYLKNKNELKHLDQDIAQYLQEKSLEKILSLTPEQHTEDHSAIKQQVIARGEMAIETIIKLFTSDFLPNISYLVIALIALSWYSPIIGGVTFFICIILTIWVVLFTRYYRPFIQKNRDNWTEQHKIRTEAFTHLQLIKLLGRETYFVKKYISNRKKYADYDRHIGSINLTYRTQRGIFVSSADNFIFFGAVLMVLYGMNSIGGIFLVWSVVGRVFWSINGLTRALRDLPLRIIEAEKYFEAIDLLPSFQESGIKKADWHTDIVFENITFKYQKSDRLIFNKINFTIPANKITAFVGSSGSGKSTLIKLLLRAYDYPEGSIKIGHTELKKVDARYLRDHVGYVEQHVDLLDDTILENILISVPDKKRKHAEASIEEIARRARIDQFYHRLGEKKFATEVGERGIKLSGGERQRIGIARAIIKDPEILIFDEATSSLDSENEKRVMEAINDVSKGKTTIIIAHRLSTVRKADKIIVMDKGMIIGEGTHEELMESSSAYQDLVRHQLS